MSRLLILDGNSVLNRAFYAIKILNASDSTPTNGVYGFLNTLFKNMEANDYSYICAAFDVNKKTFRNEQYSDYKLGRKSTPSELGVQFPIVKEILRAMNIAIIEKEGYEADDVIGTVSRMCEEKGIMCDILTGDRDLLTLISRNVSVRLTTNKLGKSVTMIYDFQAVFDKYGVSPCQLVEVKALTGDKSDNIPGVSGIGEKTALRLVSEYKNLESIFDNLNSDYISSSVCKKLEKDKEQAFLSRELATICRDVPIGVSIDDLASKLYDVQQLKMIFERLNFKSFSIKLKDLQSGGSADV